MYNNLIQVQPIIDNTDTSISRKIKHHSCGAQWQVSIEAIAAVKNGLIAMVAIKMTGTRV